MSLTSFLSLPDVTAKVMPFRPKPPRKIPAQLKVEPRSNRFTMVGTAFDYFLRFALQRRASHAISQRWVAEDVPAMIWTTLKGGGATYMQLWKDGNGTVSLVTGPEPGEDDEELAKETAKRASNVVAKAKSAHAAFVTNGSPTQLQQAELAGHAIRLAKLDVMYRAQQLDPSFEEAAPEDIEDLLEMLAIVPFESLLHGKVFILNPTFGETSLLVGGADSDLISGDSLVDFKTTKKCEIQVRYLDQLFGYFLLARNRRRADPTFPEIKRVAIYFCRQAYLWTLDVSMWTSMPEFPEVEQWFFKRAGDVFGGSKQRATGKK